jgi:hypothetical protein
MMRGISGIVGIGFGVATGFGRGVVGAIGLLDIVVLLTDDKDGVAAEVRAAILAVAGRDHVRWDQALSERPAGSLDRPDPAGSVGSSFHRPPRVSWEVGTVHSQTSVPPHA